MQCKPRNFTHAMQLGRDCAHEYGKRALVSHSSGDESIFLNPKHANEPESPNAKEKRHQGF